MKTSCCAAIAIGIVYLYLLEAIGKWMTRDLQLFENSLKAEKEIFDAKGEFPSREVYKRALYHLALDDLIQMALPGEDAWYSYNEGQMERLKLETKKE